MRPVVEEDAMMPPKLLVVIVAMKKGPIVKDIDYSLLINFARERFHSKSASRGLPLSHIVHA